MDSPRSAGGVLSSEGRAQEDGVSSLLSMHRVSVLKYVNPAADFQSMREEEV